MLDINYIIHMLIISIGYKLLHKNKIYQWVTLRVYKLGLKMQGPFHQYLSRELQKSRPRKRGCNFPESAFLVFPTLFSFFPFRILFFPPFINLHEISIPLTASRIMKTFPISGLYNIVLIVNVINSYFYESFLQSGGGGKRLILGDLRILFEYWMASFGRLVSCALLGLLKLSNCPTNICTPKIY